MELVSHNKKREGIQILFNLPQPSSPPPTQKNTLKHCIFHLPRKGRCSSFCSSTFTGASPPDFEESFQTGRAVTWFGWFSSLCITGQLTLWLFKYYFTITLDDYAGLLLDRSGNLGGGVFNSNRRCCCGSSLFEDTKRTLSSATFVCIRRTSGLSRQNGLELRSAMIIRVQKC
jgi:hypothetical protein